MASLSLPPAELHAVVGRVADAIRERSKLTGSWWYYAMAAVEEAEAAFTALGYRRIKEVPLEPPPEG